MWTVSYGDQITIDQHTAVAARGAVSTPRARSSGRHRSVAVCDQRAVGECGVTMQDAALDPTMTGREHLALLVRLWGHDGAATRTRTRALLEEFGLTRAAGRVIRTYSGGMRRRLDIAGAVLTRPAVLFLDEPTTGLDAQSRRALWTRVQAMRDDGVAVFLTTQYLEEAEELADRAT
jgi:ABC-2 type transport system ATP-binding protein